jgi:hypothetical protein
MGFAGFLLTLFPFQRFMELSKPYEGKFRP